jgi:hypothetical protein
MENSKSKIKKWNWFFRVPSPELEKKVKIIFGFQYGAKNIEGWFKICATYLVYSQIWLNPPTENHHFFYIFLWIITTSAAQKKFLKKLAAITPYWCHQLPKVGVDRVYNHLLIISRKRSYKNPFHQFLWQFQQQQKDSDTEQHIRLD